jgi:hypothetical protein
MGPWIVYWPSQGLVLYTTSNHHSGVSSNFQVKERLELSYHNTRALHKVLDDIPPRAEWHSKKLAFEDRPEDEYTIYYRNPIDAMRSLLGNPAHAKDIVYRPKKIFRDKEKSVRIYNEMWTGKWWHAIQVCFLPPCQALLPVLDFYSNTCRIVYLRELH